MITGLLVLVALSASLTHRRGPDVVRLATTEAVAAALVIGGTGGDSFAPYLLFPLISVGMAGGSLAGLLASGAASLTLALTNQLSRATGAPGADMRPCSGYL